MALQFVCDFYFSILSQQPVNSNVLKKSWDYNENIDFWIMVFRAFKFICREKIIQLITLITQKLWVF